MLLGNKELGDKAERSFMIGSSIADGWSKNEHASVKALDWVVSEGRFSLWLGEF
jgi:hypothetical protein